MKKLIIIVGTLAALSAVVIGALALYVYNLDLGVDYKGRARLDYNWKYHFAACPKEEYKYKGAFFSFSYPKFSANNPVSEVKESNGGLVSDGYLLNIFWDETTDSHIKSELVGFLSTSDGQVLPALSADFMKWCVVPPDVHVKKVAFRRGGAAMLMSSQNSKYNYLFWIAPDGHVLRAYNLAILNLPEAVYRKFIFGPFQSCTVYPDAVRDAQSACVLNRFMETFEFKK